MSKRFTATEKWDDPWYSTLSPTDRNFWEYLCDKCDHAGIWQVNWALVKFYFGPSFEYNSQAFDSKIVKFAKERWFIPKFIEFQYGELNPSVAAHRSVLSILQKQGLKKSCLTLKDKDKDKDKDNGYIPKAEKEYKSTTDIQKIIGFYKYLKGIDPKDRAWDAANFKRFSKPAKSTLDAFNGNYDEAGEWLGRFKEKMEKASLDWTLETACKWAWDSKGERNALTNG